MGPDRPNDLDQRRRNLDRALAKRRAVAVKDGKGTESEGTAGFSTAMKLSGEFIAGIVVGAGLGWMIDHFAGTSPWGLIVFLLLGFCAGILNVLRSAKLVAEFAGSARKGEADRKDQ